MSNASCALYLMALALMAGILLVTSKVLKYWDWYADIVTSRSPGLTLLAMVILFGLSFGIFCLTVYIISRITFPHLYIKDPLRDRMIDEVMKKMKADDETADKAAAEKAAIEEERRA